MVTLTLRAKVREGHLIIEDPVDLPEGAEVDLQIVDPGDELDDEDRGRLHGALLEAQSELDRNDAVAAVDALAAIRGRDRR